MNTKQNLHTHSIYCDGKDAPEKMIEAAIQKGYGSIGFSGHSHSVFSREYTMSVEDTIEYKKHIKRLKEEYKDKIDVFLGLEFDMLSDDDLSGYEYIIGTVHSLKTDKGIASFDRSQKDVEEIIKEYFGGDGMAYARTYYEQLSTLPGYGKFDILGHFDIIAKHSDNISFFDESSKEYFKWATDAMDAIKGKIPFFEVNTGAIARGYRKTPYPAVTLIKELKNRGFGVVITSDCHDCNKLDCYYENARELIKSCGFKERYILTKEGFVAVEV